MSGEGGENGKTVGRKPGGHKQGVFQRSFKKKRADGSTYDYVGKTWHICYSGPDPDRPGKTKMYFESSHSERKKDAEKLLLQRKNEVLKRLHPHAAKTDDNPLIREYVVGDDYLLHKDVVKLRGIKEHKQVLGELAKVLGKWRMSELNADKVVAYLEAKKARGNAIATRNRHLSAIKKVVNIAFSQHKAPFNTVVELKKVKKEEGENHRINYLTLDEIPLLLKHCAKRSEHLRQMVEFSAATGIRKGRVYALEWSMLDMPNEFVHLPKDKHGGPFDAPLGATAMKVLQERKKARRRDVPYVFFNPETGGRWHDLKESFKAAVSDALNEAIETEMDTVGLPTFRYHDLRHTFVSHLVMQGVSLATVKDLAGHKTIKMTLEYAHLDPSNLKAGVARLPF